MSPSSEEVTVISPAKFPLQSFKWNFIIVGISWFSQVLRTIARDFHR